jgi:succinoglycan biosynthesis protein ExoW
MTTERLAVIIPFFQREPGILGRALESVATQSGNQPISVLVVDDASPVSASEEVSGLTFPDRLDLSILARENGGPGAARNTGLNALPRDTEYVAFLDSDDAWAPDHLENALLALRAGCDFYFADIQRAWERETRFRARNEDLLGRRNLAPLFPGRDIHLYTGDFEAVVLTGLVSTPTTVYRFSRFRDLRFPVRYRFFGEDQYFWLSVGARARRIAVSLNCESHIGRGVNVWAGSRWGTEHNVRRLLHEIAFRRDCLEMRNLGANARRMSRHRLDAARRSLAAEILHHGRRGRIGLVARTLLRDPASIVRLPGMAVRAMVGRRSTSDDGRAPPGEKPTS